MTYIDKVINIYNNPKVFMIILLLILVSSFSLSIITIGGLLLVFGAWYVFAGNIFYSIIIYTLADVAWLINAYNYGDMVGTITVSIGILVGLIVTNKIRIGEFRKSIRKDNDK